MMHGRSLLLFESGEPASRRQGTWPAGQHTPGRLQDSAFHLSEAAELNAY